MTGNISFHMSLNHMFAHMTTLTPTIKTFSQVAFKKVLLPIYLVFNSMKQLNNVPSVILDTVWSMVDV